MAKGDVTMKFDAQTAKFIQDVEKARSKLRNIGEEGGKVGKKLKKTETSVASLGKGMIETFTGPLTAIGLMGSAVAATTAILKGMNDERERGAKLSSDSEIGLSQLTQLAGGDPKKLQSLINSSKQTFKEGGAASLSDAAMQVFTLESAGELEDRKFWSSLFGIVDQDSLIKSANTLKFTMGKTETGSLKDLASKAFAASKGSSATKVGPLLQASSRSAAFASGLGLSDEEVLAGTSVVATGSGSAERGGTLFSSFLKKLGEKEEDFIDPNTGEKVNILGKKNKFKQVPEFKGLSLRQSIEKIRAKNFTQPELQRFLGTSEATEAFNTLDKQLDTKGGVGDTLNDVIHAQKINKVEKIIASRSKVAAIQSPRLERISKARLALSELETFSEDEHKSNAIISDSATSSILRGESGIRRQTRGAIQSTTQFLGGSSDTVKAAGTVGFELLQKSLSTIGIPLLDFGVGQVSDARRNADDEAVKSRRER